MASYLQLGNQSWNLLEDSDLGTYSGVIVSPVNDSPAMVDQRLKGLSDRDKYEVILDPELYVPLSTKGKLGQWKYFPSDFATADHSSSRWWNDVGAKLVEEASELGVDAICTPAFKPQAFSDEYYQFFVEAGNQINRAGGQSLSCLQSALVPLRDLGSKERVMSIASVLSQSRCERICLTFDANELPPRIPYADPDQLAGAVRLVHLLSASHRVQVSSCGHDLILWKGAGATDISTGKFLNLRRFSATRWDSEEDKVRTQNAYWNENKLLVWIREQEVEMLRRIGWYKNETFETNPAAAKIYKMVTEGTGGVSWLKLSWLQYLRWASNAEAQADSAERVQRALGAAKRHWTEVESSESVTFYDSFTTGQHVRAWSIALLTGMPEGA